MTAIKLKSTDVSRRFSDETVVSFQPSASEAFDRSLDALKLISPNREVPSLFSFSSDQLPLSINALPDSLNSVGIPIGFINLLSGKFQFELLLPRDAAENPFIFFVDEINQCYYDGYINFPLTLELEARSTPLLFTLIVQRETKKLPSQPLCIVQEEKVMVKKE